MSNMPVMPSLNKSSSGDEINSSLSSSPLTDDSASAESDVSLNVPLHEEKPAMVNIDKDISTQLNVPSAPKKGIEVVAQMKGFYNQKRYNQGDSFLIKSEEQFGSWMKCVDPAFEKKRIEIIKLRKAKK